MPSSSTPLGGRAVGDASAPDAPSEVKVSPFGRLIRFVAVGVVNTCVGYGLYLAFLWSGLPYPAAWGLSMIISLIQGFILSGRLVFGRVPAWRFVLYALAWAVLFALNIALIEVLLRLKIAGITEATAPLVLLPLNVILSFFIQKMLVFRPARGG